MIEVEQLRKQFGDLVAVDGVTFDAQPGAIFGLLGPNGAGKSTTIGCLCGLLTPSAGRVRVLGVDVVSGGAAARRVLGIVPQEVALYDELSARDNLMYWGGAQGMSNRDLKERIPEVLAITGLADRSREPLKRFSGGMKRRLNFACGIVHRPKVLLLDEPTVGVDPQSRVKLLDLVREQARQGACVLYTTHYMEEAEALCDRLAIIDHGKLIAKGTLEELRGMLGERDLVRLSGHFPVERVRETLDSHQGMEIIVLDENQLSLAAVDGSRRLPEIFALLSLAGAEIRGTTLTQPSLESLFIKLTGKELRE